MNRKYVVLVIAAALLIIVLGLCVPNVGAYVKDVCWVENYLETDFTVCQVENGIYILTPTPTGTPKPKVKIRQPRCYDPLEPWQCQVLTYVPTWINTVDNYPYPAPVETQIIPTITPRPTPTLAPDPRIDG
jgi:hypothetical protein